MLLQYSQNVPVNNSNISKTNIAQEVAGFLITQTLNVLNKPFPQILRIIKFADYFLNIGILPRTNNIICLIVVEPVLITLNAITYFINIGIQETINPKSS